MRSAAVFAIGLLAVMPAYASDYDDVINTLNRYEQAYAKGDLAAWTDLCAGNAVIIDNYPPHVWQGTSACADWWKAQAALNAQHGNTNTAFSHREPVLVGGDGNYAYVMMLEKFSYTEAGVPGAFNGLWTVTLQKTSAGWRITSWTWSDR